MRLQPCYNTLQIHPPGFGENQRAQAEWVNVAACLFVNNLPVPTSAGGALGVLAAGTLVGCGLCLHVLDLLLIARQGQGAVAGGCVSTWMDELWKSAVVTRVCWGWIKYGQPGFDPGQCEYKVSCQEYRPCDVVNSGARGLSKLRHQQTVHLWRTSGLSVHLCRLTRLRCRFQRFV